MQYECLFIGTKRLVVESKEYIYKCPSCKVHLPDQLQERLKGLDEMYVPDDGDDVEFLKIKRGRQQKTYS